MDIRINWKTEYKKLLWLLPGFLFYAVFRLCIKWPAFTETVYSRTLFPPINRALSFLTNGLPFSLGEFVFYASVLGTFAYAIDMVVRSIRARRGWWRVLVRRILALSMAVSMAYMLFVGLWGLNYARMPLGETLGLDTSAASVEELYATCRALAQEANALRTEAYDTQAVSVSFARADIMSAVSTYYDTAAQALGLSFLGGYDAAVKPVAYSTGLSAAWITGIYFPFTGEANVNMEAPMLLFPATCLHETAHQRGFAREDEANFLAYYVSTYADNTFVRYSGTMLALIHTMDALYRVDSERYANLCATLNGDIIGDIEQLNEYWKQYESAVSEVAVQVNNGYLQANMQQDGVKSYGGMVDLLIGLWRQGAM